MKIMKLFEMFKNRANRESIYASSEYWDSKAIELDGDAVSMWYNEHLNKLYHAEQVALLESVLPDLNGKAVVDVGCGTGRLSRFFADKGAHVVGVDFSKEAVAIAKRLTSHSNVQFRVESVFDMEDVASFELACAWGCLVMAARNEQELIAALRRLHQSLVSDGNLLLLEPVHKGFLHRVLNMKFSRFLEILDDVGFEVQWTRQMHFWPMRLMLAYIRLPRFITVSTYQFGQMLMKLPVLSGMGDYKVAYARKKAKFDTKATAEYS